VKAAAVGLLTLGAVCAWLTWPIALRDGPRIAVPVLVVGLVAVGVGVASALRRGGTAFGLLLALAGSLWFVSQWNTATIGNAALFSVAIVCWGALPAVSTHAALAYPSGRLPSFSVRIAVVAGYLMLVGVLGVLPALVFNPVEGGCQACPDNVLLLASATRLAGVLPRIGGVSGMLTAVVLAAVCIAKGSVSSSAARRRTGLLLGSAVVMLLATAAILFRSVVPAAVPLDQTTAALVAVQGISLCTLALGDVVEWVRVRRARSRMARYALEIGRSATTGDMRQVLAAELGEPGLALAYPLDDGRLVDSSGAPSRPGGDGRATTALAIDGRTVAVLTHRAGLSDDHRFVGEVLSAARLPLDNERLWAQARAQVTELAASRIRIIESGETERRRLERDLHDGAQQRLVALMLTLRLARSTTTDAADVELIDAAIGTLREVVASVRRVASGIYPAVLAEAGLRAGLLALAEESPHPMHVLAVPPDRLPAATETAVYLMVSALIRCGPVKVSIVGGERALAVDVVTSGYPDSMTEIEDRIGALGGTLTVDRSSTGTSAHAELPCGL